MPKKCCSFTIESYNQSMTNKPTYTVCIVEDEAEFRQWLIEEIEESEHFECLASYETAREALKHIPALSPDVTIMDLGLNTSEFDGIECMLRLKENHPSLRFLVITSFSNDEKIFEALRVGAGAYILKDDIPDKLINVLTDFVNDGSPMSASIAQKVVRSFHKSVADLHNMQTLSPREMEVLDLISKGYLNKEIKQKLNISVNTVKVITYKIYKKLQVNNRVEAVKKYLNLH